MQKNKISRLDKNLSNTEDSEKENSDHSTLRPFETLDIQALTQGFEPDEIKEGKLVLYITEGQFKQLMKQKAIIVPNTNTLLNTHDFSKQPLSLQDKYIGEKLGRESPIKEVELVIDQKKIMKP